MEDQTFDMPIFIDGEELVERPRFTGPEDLASYVAQVAEGRDFIMVLEHPHTDESNVVAVYIGKGDLPKCPHGCDDRA